MKEERMEQEGRIGSSCLEKLENLAGDLPERTDGGWISH